MKYRTAKKCHNFQHCCIWLHHHWLWSHLGFFYYSKVEFTTVNTFSNVTGFSHFTMVNTDLVCCRGNGGRMKAKFTIVKKRYDLLLIFLNFVYSVDSFIRGKSTVNSGFQGIIRLHLMFVVFVFHFWVEHKFRSKSFNSSVFLFRVATFFLSIVWIWILVGTLFLRNFHVIYQTWDAVFHHQMKHRSIFDELRGVSSGDETLCRMFDISSQTKSFLKEKLRMQNWAVFHLISKHSLNINFHWIFFMNY